jgi:hypothetical protein
MGRYRQVPSPLKKIMKFLKLRKTPISHKRKKLMAKCRTRKSKMRRLSKGLSRLKREAK